MVRCLRRISRLCGCFASQPRQFLETLKSLPDWIDAKAFSRSFPLSDSTKATPPSSNPLLDFFDSYTVGPGIWKWKHYFDVYHRHLHRFVGTDAVVAEIGVFSGGSMMMWRNYFGPQARIHGIDLDPATKSYEVDGVTIHVGDQESRGFWRTFRQSVPRLDVLIDDGGHSPQQQRVSIEEILPHLAPGGVYICEDIVGGINDFSAYVGGLVSSLNDCVANHSPTELRFTATSFQRGVCSIHCYPYMVVVERAKHTVDEFVSERHGTEWQPPVVIQESYGKILGRGG